MKKEANYVNINWRMRDEQFDTRQFMDPAKKHL